MLEWKVLQAIGTSVTLVTRDLGGLGELGEPLRSRRRRVKESYMSTQSEPIYFPYSTRYYTLAKYFTLLL